jgi:hypothetical protein
METVKSKAWELINNFVEFAADEKGVIKFTEENKFKIKKIAWNVADCILFEVYANKERRRFYEDVMEEIEKFDFEEYLHPFKNLNS